MTEFITKKMIFDNCYEAMQYMIEIRKPMRMSGNKLSQDFRFHEVMTVVNDFLALSAQFEKQPTKNYEHYPRLAKEWAIELIEHAYNDTPKEIVKEFINSYTNNFQLENWIN